MLSKIQNWLASNKSINHNISGYLFYCIEIIYISTRQNSVSLPLPLERWYVCDCVCVCVCMCVLVYVCAQLCPTFSHPMDSSLPGSSVQRIFQARNTEVECHFLLQGKETILTRGLNPRFLHLRHWQVDFFFTTSATWEACAFSILFSLPS